MSKINAHNLDELLFDYLEGNLSPSEAAELEGFLKAHPEHAAELEAWKATYVKPAVTVPVYAGAQGLVQSGVSGWFGGLNLLGWGGLVVAVVTVAVLFGLSGPSKQDVPSQKAEPESNLVEVNEPEPLVKAADTVMGDTVPLTFEVIDTAIFTPPISYNYPPPPTMGYKMPLPADKNLLQQQLDNTYSAMKAMQSHLDSIAVESPDSNPLPMDTLAPVVADTSTPTDNIQILPPKTNDFSTQRSTPTGKKGKKKRNKKAKRPKKPVRVVPLKSDAF